MPQPKLPTENDRQLFAKHRMLVSIVAVFCCSNFLVGILMQIFRDNEPGGMIVYGMIGVVLSEMVLAGMLFALLPVNLLMRCFVTALAAGLFAFTFFISLMFQSNFELVFLFRTLDLWPLIIVSVAWPFSAAKHLFGWRLEFRTIPFRDSSRLTISGLLAATAIIAVVIAFPNMTRKNEMAIPLATAGVFSGMCLLVFVPSTALLFRARNVWPWLLLLTVTVFLISILVFNLLPSKFWPRSFWEIVGPSFTISMWLFWFGASVRAMRASGIDLQSSHDHALPTYRKSHERSQDIDLEQRS